MTQDNNTIKLVFPAQQREERVSGHQSQALEEQPFRTSGTNTSVTESHFHFRRGGGGVGSALLSETARRDFDYGSNGEPPRREDASSRWLGRCESLKLQNELTGRAATQPNETNGTRLSTFCLRQLGLTSGRAVRRVYKNFSCHRWARALVPGNNERPARCFVSSAAMQQRPLSMRPWWHPINIRKYGLWAGGYCSRWRSHDNIFTDKCLSTEINIVPRSAQANSMALCKTPNSSGPRREPTLPPPLRYDCGLLSKQHNLNSEVSSPLLPKRKKKSHWRHVDRASFKTEYRDVIRWGKINNNNARGGEHLKPYCTVDRN